MPNSSSNQAVQEPSASSPGGAVAANYAWWREHGAEYAPEYDRLKTVGPKYHLSEFILCDYAVHSAPARVLEFGCGPGRHLRYLREVPGIDAHGYDQSATMAGAMLHWAPRAWFDSHVSIGLPTGRLPYDDGAFELVFTASVLVHVRPEDLPGVLRELLRVSRGHVVHLEARPGGRPAYRETHDGCWTHQLPAAYAALGVECTDLMPGLPSITIFRALTPGTAARYSPSPVLMALYDRMVRDLTPA